MNLGWLLLNGAYLIYAISGAFRDVLRLRLVLALATVLFMVYGVVAGIWSVFWWNIPVLAIHTWRSAALIAERRGAELDAKAEAVHTLLMPELDRVCFAKWWHTGAERVVDNATLTRQGMPVDELFLVIEGSVDVSIGGQHVISLGPLRLIGEASSLTGTMATATVVTRESTRLRVWDKTELDELYAARPEIESAFFRFAGQDLAKKLGHAGSERPDDLCPPSL